MQDAIVLLQQVNHLLREEVGNLLSIHTRDMCHEFKVINQVLFLLGWVLLECLQFLLEDSEMYFELLLVVLTVPLNLVL